MRDLTKLEKKIAAMVSANARNSDRKYNHTSAAAHLPLTVAVTVCIPVTIRGAVIACCTVAMTW